MYDSGLMVLTASYQAAVHSLFRVVFTRYQNTESVIRFYFQNTFVMKMNWGILESCIPIVTKQKSSKGTPMLTFIVIKILLVKRQKSKKTLLQPCIK